MRTHLTMLVVALQLAGCAAFLNRNAPAERTLDDILGPDYLGSEMVLISSLRSGSFFGDSSVYLADNRPEQIIELMNYAGRLLPTPELGDEQVPAGTRVRVVDFFVPGESTADITSVDVNETPTAHPWVVLERTEVIGRGQRHVIVLPRGATTPLAFTAALGRYVARPHLARELFEHQPKDIRRSIEKKEITAGMSVAEMLAALGEPRNFASYRRGALTPFTADYGNIKVLLEGPTVTAIEGLEAASVDTPSGVADALAAITAVAAAPADDLATDAVSDAADDPEPAPAKVKKSSKKKKSSKAHKKKRGRGRGR